MSDHSFDQTISLTKASIDWRLDLLDNVLDLFLRKTPFFDLLIELINGCKLSQIAIDFGGHVTTDQLFVAQPKTFNKTIVLSQHILLVVVLRLIEHLKRQYLRHYWSDVFSLSLFHRFFCQLLLLLIMIEDGRHILSFMTSGGRMVGPKQFQ